ncbi:LysR substrate-binding domain-containing protein [Neorhizobium sp. DT-125]|uniref:LysR substrate-binding domain-containing protein n=1 Tax=Neorhizobium sp. DT-125 TaxID=3396163 RepID=UPI003F1934EF
MRIGILTSLAGGFLRQLVQAYAERHPQVSIDLRDGGRREHLAAVRAQQGDFKLFANPSLLVEPESDRAPRINGS